MSYRTTLFSLFGPFVKIQAMDVRSIWIAVIGAVLGIAAGFLVANSVNRSELSRLRAENEAMKSASSGGQQPSASTLSVDEINATIQKADQAPTDFQMQRNVGIAIYQYAAAKNDVELLKHSARILDRATKLRPDDADVTLALGNAHFDIGYFSHNNDSLAKAREYYTKAISSRPNDVGVRTDLGLTYFLQTPPDYAGSVDEFRKALAIDPKNEKTLQYIVQALIKEKNSAQADNYLRQLREVNPKNESIAESTSLIANLKASE